MEPYISEIRLLPYPMSYSGSGGPVWLRCDGATVLIQAYQALYSLTGNAFGGDGRTNFNLPDLRGRTPIAIGADGFGNVYSLGTNGGLDRVSLTLDQVPPHSHAVTVSTAPGTTALPRGAFPAVTTPDINQITPNLYAPYSPTNVTQLIAQSLSASGGGGGHENSQPSMVLEFFICADHGVYPVRPSEPGPAAPIPGER